MHNSVNTPQSREPSAYWLGPIAVVFQLEETASPAEWAVPVVVWNSNVFCLFFMIAHHIHNPPPPKKKHQTTNNPPIVSLVICC